MGFPDNNFRILMQANAQTITGVGTTSGTNSSALPAGAVGIRIVADGAIWYSTNGSASAAAGVYLPANVIDYAACGASSVINFLAVTTNGRTAWITPFSS